MIKSILPILFFFVLSGLPGQAQIIFEKQKKQIFDCVVLEKSNEIAFQQDKNLRVIDISTLLGKKMIPLDNDFTISSLTQCQNDSLIALGYTNGAIQIIDVINSQTVSGDWQLVGTITALAFSNDEKSLAASSDNGELVIFNYSNQKFDFRYENMGFIPDLQFTEDERFLIGGGEQGLFVINTQDGKVVSRSTTESRNWIRGIVVDSEKGAIVSGDDKGFIRRWSYDLKGQLSGPETLFRASPWISGIETKVTNPEYILYSTNYGIVKLRLDGEVFSLKRMEMIYNARVICLEPEIKIAVSIRDRGLAIYELSQLKKEAVKRK